MLTGNFLEIYVLKLISKSLIKNSGSVARNWGLGLPYRVRPTLSLSDAQKIDSQGVAVSLESGSTLEVVRESDKRT